MGNLEPYEIYAIRYGHRGGHVQIRIDGSALPDTVFEELCRRLESVEQGS